jgi:hypothetical protein
MDLMRCPGVATPELSLKRVLPCVAGCFKRNRLDVESRVFRALESSLNMTRITSARKIAIIFSNRSSLPGLTYKPSRFEKALHKVDGYAGQARV